MHNSGLYFGGKWGTYTLLKGSSLSLLHQTLQYKLVGLDAVARLEPYPWKAEKDATQFCCKALYHFHSFQARGPQVTCTLNMAEQDQSMQRTECWLSVLRNTPLLSDFAQSTESFLKFPTT